MGRAGWLGALTALALLGCNDGSGGPPPCAEDAECVSICDAACVPDAALAAVCDDFLQACVCDCEEEAATRMMGTSSLPK